MAQVIIYLKKLHRFAGIGLYLQFGGMICVSLLEGIGLFMLLPMLDAMGLFDLHTGQIPLVSRIVEPLGQLPGRLALPAGLGLFILLLLGQALLMRHQTNRNLELQQGYIRHLRLEVYRALLQANWSLYLRQRKSDFHHMMTSELGRVSQGTYLSLRIAANLLFTLVHICLAMWLSWPLTVLVLCCSLAIALYSRKFVTRSQALGDRTTRLSQEFMAGLTDHFNGMKDIKSNRMEDRNWSWFRGLCDKLEHNFVQFARLQTASQFNYKAASAVLIAGFVYLSLEVLHAQPEELVMTVAIFSRLWPRFSGLQSDWEQIAQSIPAYVSLRDLVSECYRFKELELHTGESRIAPEISLDRGIECRNVWYRYDSGQPVYALQGIDLRIPANSMTAVVGKSGAGKSTLIDIITGLLQPEKGMVLVDGAPLVRDMAIRIRESVGYVSQDPFLFHASVRDNLSAAAPGATEEEMWEALSQASADSFVRNLPEGLDTVLGDRGVRLSGGERQRVVLARALLRKPRILILDEATSALDVENERNVQLALDRLKGRLTIIVIAHRLSTIRHADQVIVLDQGRIIQQGSYKQVAAETMGAFNRLQHGQAVGANG